MGESQAASPHPRHSRMDPPRRPLPLFLAAGLLAFGQADAAAGSPPIGIPSSPCRGVDPSSADGRALAVLAAEVAEALVSVDADRLAALGTARFRGLMDLPALRDYAQKATSRGLVVGRPDRLDLTELPTAPLTDRPGWFGGACGGTPGDPGWLEFEARGFRADALVVAEGPLVAEPRERGRIVLMAERADGGYRVADLGVTRASLLGRSAGWYLERAARLAEPGGDPWAAREASERAVELAFLGHRLKTGLGEAAQRLRADLPSDPRPAGEWLDAAEEGGPPFPLRSVARHDASLWPELRVEYLGEDPDAAEAVAGEADRLMRWLEAAHPGLLSQFHRVRFAPATTRAEPRPGHEVAVKTVRLVRDTAGEGG